MISGSLGKNLETYKLIRDEKKDNAIVELIQGPLKGEMSLFNGYDMGWL
ncbi:hypothetical protein [Methanocella conradii]|nr:hypothetical protein [Methanocella conradii]MDI6896547.1 hypothetical protein [Methanocella conradii]